MGEEKTVSLFAYEAQGAHFERVHKRDFIEKLILYAIILVLGVTLYITMNDVATEVVTIEAEQETDGLSKAYIIGGDYGYGYETESEDN